MCLATQVCYGEVPWILILEALYVIFSVSIVETVSILCVCVCVRVVPKFHSEKSVLHAFSPSYIVLGIQ